MAWKSLAVVHQSRKTPVYTKEFEIDKLTPNQVVIQTEYASINPVDVKLHALSFTSTEKHTLKDFSGKVVGLGDNVRGKLEIGQEVWGSILRPSNERFVGSYTVVDYDADVIAPLPKSLTPQQGACLGVVFGTAFQMLEKAATDQTFGPESSILVLGGATSVGSFVSQIAKKYFKIGKVVVTSSPSSAEYAKSFGADETINYRVPDIRSEFVKYVERAGKPFDAIIDTVGGYDALAVFPKILKPASQGSAYISIMGDSGPAKTYAETMIKALLNLPFALFRLAFGKYYGINYYLFLLEKDPKWIATVPEFFSIPGVKVPIDSVLPLRDIKEAWAKVDSTRARGKVVVQF